MTIINTPQTPPQPLTVLVCALGGEGGGVVSEWLYDAAMLAGYPVQCTSVPGVAQRTGATTYYIEIFPQPEKVLQGRRPVFSLNPVPGALDLLVSSELLETVRQVGQGMSSPQRTQVISSVARALTVAEKMQMGDGRVNTASLASTLQTHCRAADLMDMAEIARRAGTVISAVLLGAVAGSGVLPLPRTCYEQAIRRSGKGVEASLRGFAEAFHVLDQQRRQREAVSAALQPHVSEPLTSVELQRLGRERVVTYQDEAYGRLYDERMRRITQAELAARGGQTGSDEAQAECARWLALWMAFDDTVQVARLKLAASRLQRVQREAKVQTGELLKVYDHFKPGAAEVAALLPPPLARRLLAWDQRRVAAGKEPWALPLKVGAHTVTGAVALWLMASGRALRRLGSRFEVEQALIERWLSAVEQGLGEHATLGLELARCGRLIKGYGSTHERGKENLLHILDHLAFAPGQAASVRAQAVASARTAALADDSGKALDQTLIAHGAAPRPVRAQTIRWYKRKPA